jgi:hypothetical protein
MNARSSPEGSSLADLRDAIERVSEVIYCRTTRAPAFQERASPVEEKEGPILDLLNRGQKSSPKPNLAITRVFGANVSALHG